MFSRVVAFLSLSVLPVATIAAGPAQTTVPAQPLAEAASTPPDFYAADPVLAGYISAALDANPGLQAAFHDYRAALDEVPIAKALPDPMLDVGQALVRTPMGPARETVMVSQMFPWFGTLDLRGQIADQAAVAARHTFGARQRDVIVQVKTAYYNLAYVDDAIGVAGEEQSLLGHYEDLAEARYASGQGLQQAAIKIQAEITKVVTRLDTLRQQRDTLAAQLNTLMNRPPETFVPAVPPPVTSGDVALDLQQLEAVGDAERPEIQAADALIARGRRTVELAGKDVRPDFTVGAGYMDMGPSAEAAAGDRRFGWSVSFGLTLPIQRAKYQAGVRRAGEDLSAATAHRADAHNQMTFAVRDQVLRIETLGEQLRLVRDVLLPQTDEALRSTEAAYETAQVGVLDLLDSERTRLDVRLVYARDTADYLVALAELERAIGAAFPRETRQP